MVDLRFLFIPITALFFVRLELPMTYKIRVLKVYDGDTLLIKFGPFKERLRLFLIDAPELSQPDGVGEYAKKCLVRVLYEQKELILIVGFRDVYGRLLGNLKGVSERLIQEGCTGFYPYAQFSSAAEKMFYLRLQKEAREKKNGLWGIGGYRQPSLWRKTKKQNGRQRPRR